MRIDELVTRWGAASRVDQWTALSKYLSSWAAEFARAGDGDTASDFATLSSVAHGRALELQSERRYGNEEG